MLFRSDNAVQTRAFVDNGNVYPIARGAWAYYPEAAAVRLPLSPTLPLREPPAPADLVLDRYSAAKVYLDGLCVEDVE